MSLRDDQINEAVNQALTGRTAAQEIVSNAQDIASSLLPQKRYDESDPISGGIAKMKNEALREDFEKAFPPPLHEFIENLAGTDIGHMAGINEQQASVLLQVMQSLKTGEPLSEETLTAMTEILQNGDLDGADPMLASAIQAVQQDGGRFGAEYEPESCSFGGLLCGGNEFEQAPQTYVASDYNPSGP